MMNTKTTKHKYCLNCNTPFTKSPVDGKEVFCVECGQSSKANSLSLFLLIKDAFSNIFNLDSRLVHTLRDIIFPSKLTKTYIAGKRKYYVNPGRLFIFTLIVFISLALSVAELDGTINSYEKMIKRVDKSLHLAEYNQLVDTIEITIDQRAIDTIRTRLFYNVLPIEQDTISSTELDIFVSGDSDQGVKTNGITYYDILNMSSREILKKYKIEDYWNQIMISQFIRFSKNSQGAIQYIIKNMVWAVFFSAIFISLIFGLLYARSSYHLIEHGVLILNTHSLVFFFLSLSILLVKFLNIIYPFTYDISILKGWPIASLFISLIIVQFLALKRYYGQGIIKTLIKQFVITVSYIIIFFIVATIVGLISALIF